jgi:hypothetical protein
MAESKKKIIITKKKTIIKKSPAGTASKTPVKVVSNKAAPVKVVSNKAAPVKESAETAPPPENTPAPQVKASSKKVQITKKKVQVTKKKATASVVKEAPPPEVISTSEIKDEKPAETGQKTMVADAPIGAPSHKDEPTAIKKKEAFKFYCIRCGQKLEAYYDWVGRSIGCPRCKASIKIPEPLS